MRIIKTINRPKGYLTRKAFSRSDEAWEVIGYRVQDVARTVNEVMAFLKDNPDVFKQGISKAPREAIDALANLVKELDGRWIEPEYLRPLKKALTYYGRW